MVGASSLLGSTMSTRPLLLLLAVLPGLAACDSIQTTELRAAYLQSELSGDIAVGPSTGGASLDARRNSLTGDLGIDDSNPSLLVSGAIRTTIGRFGGSAFWFDDSSTGTLGQDFGDIPLGTAVDTRFEFLNVKTYWVYDVVEERDFRIAPGIAVNFIDMQTEVRSTAAAQAFEEVEVFAPVPMLFLDGEARLGPVLVAAQGGGMRIDLDDGIGTYWDFEGRVGFEPTDDVEVFAGYRYLSIDSKGIASSRDAKVDIDVHGWFLGGAFRF